MAPVELTRPTILSCAAIICYALAMMFQVIAFATDNWSSLLLEGGVRWRVGLWRGCRHNVTTDTWHCGTDVFQDPVFQTGISAEWHTGSQVMMTISLVVLFLLEFLVVGYACIKRLEQYKDKLVGGIVTLSLSSGGSTLVTVCLCGANIPGSLEWSFGAAVLSLAFTLLTFSIVLFDGFRAKWKCLHVIRRTFENESEASKTENTSEFCNTNTVVDLTLDEDAF